jgi:ppGpp synthetase/RelA/SpoT-type nucleotidyltranferase
MKPSEYYERILRSACDFFDKLWSENSLYPSGPSFGRVKDGASSTIKLATLNISAEDPTVLGDFIGVRTVFVFTDDVEKAARLVRENCKLVKDDPKSLSYDIDRFNYMSTHFNILIPSAWQVDSFTTPTTFELQLRTVAQHSWAEVTHDLQYKSKVVLQDVFLRQIYRAAALVELADAEYSQIRKHHQSSLSRESEIKQSKDFSDVVLEDILSYVWPPEAKPWVKIDFNYLRTLISQSQIYNTSDLLEVLKNNRESALKRSTTDVIGVPNLSNPAGLHPNDWVGLTRLALWANRQETLENKNHYK